MDGVKLEFDDSRLKGYSVRHDDLMGVGLQQLYCPSCGKPSGAIRFDDPDNGRVSCFCNSCIEIYGRPPLQECARLNKG
jgi:hypothetical protein